MAWLVPVLREEDPALLLCAGQDVAVGASRLVDADPSDVVARHSQSGDSLTRHIFVRQQAHQRVAQARVSGQSLFHLKDFASVLQAGGDVVAGEAG